MQMTYYGRQADLLIVEQRHAVDGCLPSQHVVELYVSGKCLEKEGLRRTCCRRRADLLVVKQRHAVDSRLPIQRIGNERNCKGNLTRR